MTNVHLSPVFCSQGVFVCLRDSQKEQ